jgi:hypothetical protein
MIIAIDFDGTISRGPFPEIRGEVPYAAASLREIAEKGHYIIIWTCRSGSYLLNAVNWLLERGIPFHRVNDHNPDNMVEYGPGGKKVFADVYIDDQNLGGFPGWTEAMEILKQHPNW